MPESDLELKSLVQELSGVKPFSLLSNDQLLLWLKRSKIISFEIGARFLRPDQLSDSVFWIRSGRVRCLGIDPLGAGQVTISTAAEERLHGWLSLLRAQPSEFVQCSTNVELVALPADTFIEFILSTPKFAEYFFNKSSIFEIHGVCSSFLQNSAYRDAVQDKYLLSANYESNVFSCDAALPDKLPDLPKEFAWHLSTPNVPNWPVGSVVRSSDLPLGVISGLKLPYRLVSLPSSSSHQVVNDESSENNKSKRFLNSDYNSTANLESLGILEFNPNRINDFPSLKNKKKLDAYFLGLIQLLCDNQKVPIKLDLAKKIIDQALDNEKFVSPEMLARICELMGLSSQIGECIPQNFYNVQTPSLVVLEDRLQIYWGMSRNKLIFGNPIDGNYTLKSSDLEELFPEKIKFIVLSRSSTASDSRFGWKWFTPLIMKYKTSLALVFLCSLLAQLFALAIPLLIQQIIDKVLSQGNLSSLNILGATMITLALFQGVLQVLRTYVFVDTTDRLDLALGSSVITRLLSLPLSYFEKRPVGELSQRLGELNSIRSFLTGTALISVLNIVFALIYLVIMFVYSPPLSVVALSTIPVYVLMIVVISPIYKTLIRKRAVASAKTQSHLIEVISGIQTVKAQHFELNARWKWQDRYRNFVDQGFKSVALGSATGEFGSFLTQFSSLVVLWYGMNLVLNGDLSLGQLIAFRIISGMVINPILQLAGLYQGFQSVQLSMERLADIVDQPSEFETSSKGGTQLALPSISGDVVFDKVSFSFDPSASKLQLNNVTATIQSGSFIGIVGKSGSGKSTLMKLLPRLYEPKSGLITIDGYDISKVDLSSLRRQVGIVPQDSLLFEGTVSSNIALNDPDASAEEIVEASKIACAHDFIMSLPDGYATPLAEKGSNISGGQRQRIAIARTVLSNPRMLVLDEATSALDFETERQLCLNLQEWASGKTVFFITHRLSTVRSSDLILFMENGSIIESGSHDDLVNLKGSYYALYRNQSE